MTKHQVNIELTDWAFTRIQNMMTIDEVSKKEQSVYIENLLIDGLDKKRPDHALRWMYIREPMTCLKCGKEFPIATWMLQGGGVFVCQECHAKRWTTPAIEAKHQKILELENDAKCWSMEATAAQLKCEEMRKELGYLNEVKSGKQLLEETNRELDRVMNDLNAAEELQASLPELLAKKERLTQENGELELTNKGLLKLPIVYSALWQSVDEFINRLPSYLQPEFFIKLQEQSIEVEKVINEAKAALHRLLETKIIDSQKPIISS